MVIGLLRIAWAVLEVVVHVVIALLGWRDLLAQDLADLELAWHNLCCLDLIAILEVWLKKFEATPPEAKAEMVGEFVGRVLAFGPRGRPARPGWPGSCRRGRTQFVGAGQ
jgi:hypothetical protein